ncbi:hypothetical protein CMI37_31910 [Candidatus Pacearchaeota archaeon]|nr:hypothetical protein [Candidatus Pacearchaeota archaeon]|tara:strand:+ start:596 stop:811 length:216 start_codon:yes stop_codon:yes gene_type:complete
MNGWEMDNSLWGSFSIVEYGGRFVLMGESYWEPVPLIAFSSFDVFDGVLESLKRARSEYMDKHYPLPKGLE